MGIFFHEKFSFPLLLFSTWSMIGCLVAYRVKRASAVCLLAIFFVMTFSMLFAGRIAILDQIEFPVNLMVSSGCILFSMIPFFTWLECDFNEMSNEAIVFFVMGIVLEIVALYSGLSMRYILSDSALRVDRYTFPYIFIFVIFLGCALVAGGLYFIRISRRLS